MQFSSPQDPDGGATLPGDPVVRLPWRRALRVWAITWAGVVLLALIKVAVTGLTLGPGGGWSLVLMGAAAAIPGMAAGVGMPRLGRWRSGWMAGLTVGGLAFMAGFLLDRAVLSSLLIPRLGSSDNLEGAPAGYRLLVDLLLPLGLAGGALNGLWLERRREPAPGIGRTPGPRRSAWKEAVKGVLVTLATFHGFVLVSSGGFSASVWEHAVFLTLGSLPLLVIPGVAFGCLMGWILTLRSRAAATGCAALLGLGLAGLWGAFWATKVPGGGFSLPAAGPSTPGFFAWWDWFRRSGPGSTLTFGSCGVATFGLWAWFGHRPSHRPARGVTGDG